MTKGNFLNLTDELDSHIYRILKYDHLIEMFDRNVNVLSQIHNWKDKFENFQLNLGGLLDGKKFVFGFKDDFVGQCWSSKGHSEAMWGIYANDPKQRYIRIRSTPRKLLAALSLEHPTMPQDTCFVGKVQYKTEEQLQAYIENNVHLTISPISFVNSLLLKRRAFEHESEVRLIFFGDAIKYDDNGLYRYPIDPHQMITQLMADPNRDRRNWLKERSQIKAMTGFTGEIKRSKIYDPPSWNLPRYYLGD